MSEARTEELIHELAEDLRPVRPIPRLRSVLSAVLALWALVAIPGLLWRGLQPGFLESLLDGRGPGLVFLALAVAGIGGVIAAMALGVPGREVLARMGLGLGVLGLALAAGIGTVVLASGHAIDHWLAHGDLVCLAFACGAALLPAVGVVWFLGRAAPHRPYGPLIAVVAAAAGMAALGAAGAQASCPYSDPRHLMIGHVLAPAVGALLLTLPLLAALRRFAALRTE